MIAYWDTSALIKLVYLEPSSDAARRAQQVSVRVVSWDWARVEAEAAVARRGGRAAAQSLRVLFQPFEWIRLNSEHYDAIIGLCVLHRLRSADAGHLFAALQARAVHPDLVLVCFDDALGKAAAEEGLQVFA